MQILLVGSGAREDALAWKLTQSPLCDKLFIAPGNAGCERWGSLVPLKDTQIAELLNFATDNRIDLTIVGPEAPLAEGIVDTFTEAGQKIFGPTARAALIESSKSFARNLMRKHNIPSAEFKEFQSPEAAIEHLKTCIFPRVIKADGLAAGKGVSVVKNIDEAVQAVEMMMVDRKFGAAGTRILTEEFLQGQEASLLAFTDGSTILALPTAQDHKPVYDNDEGPNTGGMGSYCPAPLVNTEIYSRIENRILVPVIHGLAKAERPFSGVMYCGLMIAHNEPKVVEFNCRFGDPEIQSLIVKLQSDLLEIILATVAAKLEDMHGKVAWDPRPAVSVVLASGGYPESYKKGYEISGLEDVYAMDDVFIFHAGTTKRDQQVLTNGGRVLTVTAMAEDLPTAKARAYEAVEKISFHGMHYRKDIADKALKML
ncbi:phosphoribosylamine--glycine ligase [Planctomycetota bacterium]